MVPTTQTDNLYLSPDQQDLLLAALTSNGNSSPMFNTPGLSQRHLGAIPKSTDHGMSSYELSKSQTPPSNSALSTGSYPDGTPVLGNDLEYAAWDIDNDGTWDYDIGGDMMHESPDSNNSPDADGHTIDTPQPQRTESEKRKQPPEGDKSLDPHDAEPKRRDDKGNTVKKPGRKPLTSEPTSKRKAQNRAAQRAFRERKEKHLKDLEEKVEVLEKASESANHENGMLRAQVDRLQTELREYKRRLQTSELTRSTAMGLGTLPGFQFDFPPFGPSSSFPKLDIGNTNKGTAKKSSIGLNGGISTGTSYTGFETQGTSPQNNRTNSSSSPSASSVSHHGPNSSCGTSPEPMTGSPVGMKANHQLGTDSSTPGLTTTTTPSGDTYICKSGPLDGETETTFCEKLGMACGNPNNPIPKAPQFTTASETTSSSLDWLAQQSSAHTFDPVFNDYRDPVNDINSNLNMSFFEDAFTIPNFADLGSPLPVDPPAPEQIAEKKPDLIRQVDAVCAEDDEDEVVPGDDPKMMLSCNKIWSVNPVEKNLRETRDRISSHPRFQAGDLDMDGLCSELRSKAKCSETGVVVAENDVQEVLGKVGMSAKDFV